jgi:hypothetical protein
VLDAVERLAVPSSADAAWSAHARVDEVDDGFALTLSVDTDRGQTSRSLRSPSCDSLARAAALVIAVDLDPVAVAQGLAESESVPPPLPAPTQAAPDPSPPRRASPPSRPRTPRPPPSPPLDAPPARAVHMGARPEASLGTGLLPGLGGAAVGGALVLFGARPWRVEAGGAYRFARTAPADGRDDAGGELWIASAIARGCGVLRPGPLQLPICGGLELGAVHGEGFGPAVQSQSSTQLWVALVPSVAVLWSPRPWVGLYARVEAALSVRRPAVHLDGIGEVYRVGAVGASGSIGVEMRFF